MGMENRTWEWSVLSLQAFNQRPRVTCHYPGDRDREVWVGIMGPCMVLAQQGPWRDWVGLWGFGERACWGSAGERTNGSSGHQGLRIEAWQQEPKGLMSNSQAHKCLLCSGSLFCTEKRITYSIDLLYYLVVIMKLLSYLRNEATNTNWNTKSSIWTSGNTSSFVWWLNTRTDCLERLSSSLLATLPKPSGHSPGQPTQRIPDWAGELDQIDQRGSFQPK